MHVAFQERDPGATLVARSLVRVPLELVQRADLSVDPLWDELRGQELALAVLIGLDCGGRTGEGLERDVEVGEALVEGPVHSDVPAHCDVGEAAKGEVGLPLEALDVRGQKA